MASKSLCLASAGPPARRRETNHSSPSHHGKGFVFKLFLKNNKLIKYRQQSKWQFKSDQAAIQQQSPATQSEWRPNALGRSQTEREYARWRAGRFQS